MTIIDELAIDQYQEAAMRTGIEGTLEIFALGLAGEAGEVCDLIKKHFGHGHELDVDKLKLELGDVLWYVAGLAHLLDLNLSEVAYANLDKLKKRYPQGFSHEASRNRTT